MQQSGANPPHEWMNWWSLAVITIYAMHVRGIGASQADRRVPHGGSPAPSSCSIKEPVAMLGSWNSPLSYVPLLIYLIRRTGCPWFIAACGEPVAACRGGGRQSWWPVDTSGVDDPRSSDDLFIDRQTDRHIYAYSHVTGCILNRREILILGGSPAPST